MSLECALFTCPVRLGHEAEAYEVETVQGRERPFPLLPNCNKGDPFSTLTSTRRAWLASAACAGRLSGVVGRPHLQGTTRRRPTPLVMMAENNDLSATDLAELPARTTCSQSFPTPVGTMPYASSPRMVLTTPPANDARQLLVLMERSPIVTHDAAGTRYRWHNNCVLPLIHVSVQGQHREGTEDAAAVRISAVTIDALTNTARSVGLEGVCVRPLVRGECTFDSLSFTSTKYTLPASHSST